MTGVQTCALPIFGEKERLVRAYVRALWKNFGPRTDVPAPDMGTNAQMMCWFMDEYSQLSGSFTSGVVTGKPLGAGGSLGRTQATGFGVMICIREALKKLGLNSKGMTASIQGFGNVGQYTATNLVGSVRRSIRSQFGASTRRVRRPL